METFFTFAGYVAAWVFFVLWLGERIMRIAIERVHWQGHDDPMDDGIEREAA